MIRKLDVDITYSTSCPPKKQKGEQMRREHYENEPASQPSSPGASLKPAPFFYYNDRSQELDKNPFAPIIPIGNIIHLPCRMHVILDITEFADIVSWLPNGRSFQIHKPSEFESRVLPQFWKRCSFKSFIRQLDVWGFLPLTSEGRQHCYYQECFLRGLTHLCKNMSRSDRKTATKDALKAPKRAHEPDLNAISKIYPLPERDESHHLQMLKTSVLSGPDARMAICHGTDTTEQNLQSDSTCNASLVRDSVQEYTTQTMVSHNDSTTASASVSNASPAPLNERAHQQPLPQLQTQPVEDGTMLDMVQRQYQYPKFQSFIFPLIQMGVGNANTWAWFTNWWSGSQTAPFLLPEEEQIEMQNVPKQEQLRAQAGLVGSTLQGEVHTVQEQQNAIFLFKQLLIYTPIAEKVELAEASIRRAEFVEDKWLIPFLQSENFDAEAARKRIIEYWRLRVSILGRELAFLPLTIKNMFSQEQLQILKLGLVRILPTRDLYGRTILLLEPGRIHGETYTTDIMIQTVLHAFHAALEQQDFRNNDVVFIVDTRSAQPGHANAELGHLIFNLMNIFPFSVKAIHLLGFGNLFGRLVIPIARYFMSPSLRSRIVHHKEDGKQLLDRLQQFGLPSDRLPVELGGLFNIDHEVWVEERLARGL